MQAANAEKLATAAIALTRKSIVWTPYAWGLYVSATFAQRLLRWEPALRLRNYGSSLRITKREFLNFHYDWNYDRAALRPRVHGAGQSAANVLFYRVHVAHRVHRDSVDHRHQLRAQLVEHAVGLRS